MEFKPPSRINPDSRRSYRRRVGFQVYLPLAIAIVIIAISGFLFRPAGSSEASAYADTALAAMLVPVLLLGLVALAVLAGCIYGLALLSGWLPEPAGRAHKIMKRVRRKVQRGADISVRPLIVASALGAAIGALRSILDSRRG